MSSSEQHTSKWHILPLQSPTRLSLAGGALALRMLQLILRAVYRAAAAHCRPLELTTAGGLSSCSFNLGTMQQTVVPGLLLNFSDPHHVFVSGGKVYQVPG